jgi:arsenate reductase-like glutaredoxin family protein
MSTFGSLAQKIDPTRDYLAEALTSSAATLGQSIANTGQTVGNAIQKREESKRQDKQFNQQLDAQKEQKRLALMQGDIDLVNRQADAAAQSGASPEQVEQFRVNGITEARAKHGFSSPDRIAETFSVPQAPKQATTQAEAPKDNLYDATAAQQPQQPQAPAPKVTVGALFAGGRENQQKLEAGKNEREQIETYKKTARDLRITDEQIETDPQLSKFKGGTLRDWENIVAIAADRETKRKERAQAIIAKIQTGKGQTDDALQLKTRHESAVKPYQEVIDKGANVQALLQQNTPQANAAALKTFSRMLEPGVVTESDIRILSSPGGLLEKAAAEMQRAKDGKMTPETQKALNDAVVRVLANAEKDRDMVNVDYEDSANMLGINPRLVVGSRFRKAEKKQSENVPLDTW